VEGEDSAHKGSEAADVLALYAAGSWLDLESKLGEWAHRDPEAALQWALQLNPDHKLPALDIVVGKWIQVNPRKALQWVASNLPEFAQRDSFHSEIVASGSWELTIQALDLVRKDHKPSLASENILKKWAVRDYRTLMVHIDTLPSRTEQFMAVTAITGAMAKEDPMAALAWVTGYAPTKSFNLSAPLAQIISSTTESNRAQIESWFNNALYTPAIASGYRELAYTYGAKDPARTYYWLQKLAEHGEVTSAASFISGSSTLSSSQKISLLESIDDSQIREGMIMNVVRKWGSASPDEAINYLSQSKAISEDTRTKAILALRAAR
jgi:hypothetical protein